MADPNTPLVQDLKPLNEVKYAARDYPSIFDSLLRRLKIEYSTVYNDYATTSQGIMLIELMAYAMDAVQWYIDRRASDCFLDTARTNAAVARLVKQIGYKMGAAGAASTTLTLTFPDGTTGPFTMPARWQFEGPDGLLYESYSEHNQPMALSPGDTISIPVRQGETRLVSYTSDGTKNQQFRLASITEDRFLGHGTVESWVDGALWDEKDFLEFEKTNQYEVGYNDAPPIIQYGDGIAGNIPPLGAPIKIRFLIIDGEAGNVKANTITRSVNVLSIGGESVSFEVTNASGATGGRNLEDPEQARRLAPFSFAARGAAITKQDYEALSNSYTDPTYGSVAKAYAFNPRQPYEDAAFNALVDSISTLLDNYVNGGGIFPTGIKELEETINDSAIALNGYVDSIVDDNTDLEDLRADILSNSGAATTACNTTNTNGATVQGNCTSAKDCSLEMKTGLQTLSASISSGATDAELQDQIVALDALASTIFSLTNDAANLGGTIRNTMAQTVNDNLFFINQVTDEAAVDPPDSNLPTLIASITSSADSLSTEVTSLQTQIATIVGAAEDLQREILEVLTLIQVKVGKLFNGDCISNYVQVPILSLDVDGNYAAPSVGLMTGLQSYLDEIKEVTQQVDVIDGSEALVRAQLDMVLDVNKDAYVEAEVVSDVVATIVGLLKGRDFNQPLYLSDLYEKVKDVSAGIVWVSIEIEGPVKTPPVIDTEGNLVPAENQIIAFGSLRISDKSGNVLYVA